jgi:6-phosphogluconolactonase
MPRPRSTLKMVFVSILLLLCIQSAPADAVAPTAAHAESYWVYVGTFTSKQSKGIYLMKMDAGSGSLSKPELVAEAPSPAFLAIAPNHRFLYSVNEVDKLDGQSQGGVSAFSLDPNTGKLALLNRQHSMGRSPTHIVVDPQGKNALVANYGTGSVAVLPIQPDGTLAAPSSTDQHKGTGADPTRQEGPHAHCINVDPTGHYAISCDLGLDKLFIYKFDAANGSIAPNEPPFATVAPGAGSRHLAFHPNGKWVYVVNDMACTVTAFSWDSTHGALAEIQSITTLPADFKGQKSTAEVAVEPSGKFLYASNRGDANSIAIFSIDANNGTLKPIGHASTQGRAPRHFAIDPSGTWLLAANQDTDNIVEFRIDHETGELKPTAVNMHAPTPVCITFLRTVE